MKCSFQRRSAVSACRRLLAESVSSRPVQVAAVEGRRHLVGQPWRRRDGRIQISVRSEMVLVAGAMTSATHSGSLMGFIVTAAPGLGHVLV